MAADPLLYIAVGGMVSLATAWATHRLTTSAARESEERQANRKVGEEQRLAIRQLRREQMEPVLEFLGLSKRLLAGEMVGESMRTASPSEGVKVDEEYPAQWEAYKEYAQKGVPDRVDVVKAFLVAMASSASMPRLQEQLARVMQADESPDTTFGGAFKSADELVEQYLAGAERGA